MNHGIDLRSEAQKNKEEAVAEYERGLKQLKASFREVQFYTQILGGKEAATYSDMLAENFWNRKYLAREMKSEEHRGGKGWS